LFSAVSLFFLRNPFCVNKKNEVGDFMAAQLDTFGNSIDIELQEQYKEASKWKEKLREDFEEARNEGCSKILLYKAKKIIDSLPSYPLDKTVSSCDSYNKLCETIRDDIKKYLYEPSWAPDDSRIDSFGADVLSHYVTKENGQFYTNPIYNGIFTNKTFHAIRLSAFNAKDEMEKKHFLEEKAKRSKDEITLSKAKKQYRIQERSPYLLF